MATASTIRAPTVQVPAWSTRLGQLRLTGEQHVSALLLPVISAKAMATPATTRPITRRHGQAVPQHDGLEGQAGQADGGADQ